MTQFSEYVRLTYGYLAIAQMDLDRGITLERCTRAERARKLFERALIGFAQQRLRRSDVPSALVVSGCPHLLDVRLNDKTRVDRDQTLAFLALAVESQLRIG